MSAEIIRLARTIRRVWRIVELQPRLWRGELVELNRGIIARTETGEFMMVRHAVDGLRCGLPVRVVRQGARGEWCA